MLNLSNLISKQVISLSEAKPLGTVINVRFDDKLKELKYIEILNENDKDAETQFIDVRNIFYGESDVLTVKFSSAIHAWELPAGCNAGPINLSCYNYEGDFKGVVKDVILNKNKVEKIVTSVTEFSPPQISGFSDSLVIVNDTGNPVKITRQKPRMPAAAPESPAVTVHQASPPAAVAMPVKISSGSFKHSYQFMLGKSLLSDILSDDGKVLFKQKTVINEEIINEAKKCNKLIQLALHCD